MSGIRVVFTSTVSAANHKDSSSVQRVELTPWDLQLLLVDPIQKGLLLHKPKTTTTQANEIENSLIPHLKASLSRTLDFFAPLAGRLVAVEHHDATRPRST